VSDIFHFRRRNPGQVWAWATYDFANSAFATTILAVIFNVYYTETAANGREGVQFLGENIPGASVFSFFVALSMVIIALTSPVLAALSDLQGMKKRMLALHLVLGVGATALLATVGEGEWLWGGWIFVAAQVGFAGGNVFYNAMLYDVADPEDFGKVSGLGWAWGYLGGGFLLAINLVMLRFPQAVGLPENFFSVHDCFLSVAIWWLLFSIPLFKAVRERKPSAPAGIARTFRAAFTRLKDIIPRLRELPHFSRFFVSYLIYNDGIETVIVMASIFAKQELQFSDAEIITFFLMVQGIAFAGSLFFGWLADRWGNKRSVIASLCGWLIIVVWGWKLGLLGNPHHEFWILGVLTGIVMGGSQAASRSLQATLIPPHRSAEFFSFFGISGKFASAVGPLIFGLAVYLTGSLRYGILSLIVFFLAGLILLLFINENEGRRQALEFDTQS